MILRSRLEGPAPDDRAEAETAAPAGQDGPSAPQGSDSPSTAPAQPWPPVGPLAFATIWATGGDVARDAVFGLRAIRRTAGGWQTFERFCRPFGRSGPDGPVTARMARDFGVAASDLEGAPEPEEAWGDFEAFLGDLPTITLDRAAHAAWAAHLGGRQRPLLDPSELAALLLPGRGRPDAAALAREHSVGPRDAPRALGPTELVELVAALVGGFLESPSASRRIAALGYGTAWQLARTNDPETAGRLALALTLIDRPSGWLDACTHLFPSTAALPDGALSAAVDGPGLGATVDDQTPGWQAASHAWLDADPVPPQRDDAPPLSADDRAAVERVFREILPRGSAEAGTGASLNYREGQYSVARELAEHFGAGELFLAHAPTGTGKTLAYLVPALLWAARRDVRVGVATYTRALQEQAMRHDVPRALRLLHEVCSDVRPRVALLKGRANYLCWRTLCTHAPGPADSGSYHLSWTALALFALADSEGDLDRFPMRPPLLDADRNVLREHATLVRAVRATSDCCTTTEDRQSCGAEVARRRAERSHLVITNQSFVLARPEFFRHIVFDECEHLHEGAHQAWSHALDPRALKDLLGRLWRPGVAASATPLGRVAAASGAARASAGALVREAIDRASGALAARERLVIATNGFDVWRDRMLSAREERDAHSLLREYVESDDSAELRAAHVELLGELSGLGAALAGIASILRELTLRGRGRVRRSLELLRAELEESIEALIAWMPRAEGEVRLRPEVFYDIESDLAGRPLLTTRVLLPHEHLGRFFYPQLAGAAFLSATTWLRGSFEASARYLGLARAAEPAEDEEREPCALRTYRAPETFDYARVLLSVPRDAPSVRGDKSAFLDYVTRFVAWLGERTRGRCLVLFTNGDDCRRVGKRLEPIFRERRLSFWYQRMEGAGKEELGELFRDRVDSVLLGLDTFWFGADFPGETLEYLVLVRLPYGVPDRYHHAQCAVLGREDQRRSIYLPRALAKFRQGFGRLMRKESDRGCVFVLDTRILDPRHRLFTKELPLGDAWDEGAGGARFVQGDTDRCLHEALAHMEMLADVRRRGLDVPFATDVLPHAPAPELWAPPAPAPEVLEIREEDLPF